ncbi:MAG: LemA family protein [candidate division Zixibacteria bacterium]|nr:LemA family protein [candidate division Zixibacteria bacterium]
MGWIPILVFIAMVFLFFVILYNRLVTLRNLVKNSWHQIEVQLERRADLIPNLVETVKGYAAHEKGAFENIAKARAMFSEATDVKQKAEATNMLTSALKSLFAVVENYPELKANQNFLRLQEELSGIESRIAYERESFNDAVLQFNNTQQIFPYSVVAYLFGFTPRYYFEVDEPLKRQAPEVGFGK